MTDLELLLLSTIGEDPKMIAYRPRLRQIAGSVTATILLQQILYRWKHNNFQPFYKYKEPCNKDDYRPGDSWCEELGFSREEFDTALKYIGQKVSRNVTKDEGKLVWYWTMPDRKTWYEVNYAALCKAAIPLYVQRERHATKTIDPALPILYTKNTSKNTTKSVEGDPTVTSVPLSPPTTPPSPSPSANALIARAEEIARAETFEVKTPTVNGVNPTHRQPKTETLIYDPRKLVDGYIPAGQGATAIEVYFERYSPREHKLSKPNQDDLKRVVTDLTRWREVVTAWSQSGHKPTNIKGMLDWYRDPNRYQAPHPNGHNKPAVVANPDIKLKDWLLKHYNGNHLPTVVALTGKTEKELRDEYKQWRITNGLPPG